jgi:hypothetical protein
VGVVADFAVLPADRWPTALRGVAAAGVELVDAGSDCGLRCYRCRRGKCSVALALGPVVPGGGESVCLSSPGVAWWRRPLAMRRLSRDVWAAVLAAGGKPA